MTFAAFAAAAVLAGPARAASPLVENLHKAQSRSEPAERLEYYDRAVKAWEPADGKALLGQARYGRGQALVDSWQFAKAEPDLTAALETDPANARAYLARGKARARQARYKDAVLDLSEYAGRNPGDVEGLVLLAQAQGKTGRADAALASCRLAQQAAPDDGRGWTCEGQALMSRRDWLRADAAFTLADGKAAHRSSETLADRAVCRVALSRHDAALADYSSAIALDEARLTDLGRHDAPAPERDEQRQTAARTLFGRGRVLEFLARPADAVADYDKACGLGYDPACERAASLKPAAPAKPVKRRRAPDPRSDPGSRIYGG